MVVGADRQEVIGVFRHTIDPANANGWCWVEIKPFRGVKAEVAYKHVAAAIEDCVTSTMQRAQF